jgi:hypothetical protein
MRRPSFSTPRQRRVVRQGHTTAARTDNGRTPCRKLSRPRQDWFLSRICEWRAAPASSPACGTGPFQGPSDARGARGGADGPGSGTGGGLVPRQPERELQRERRRHREQRADRIELTGFTPVPVYEHGTVGRASLARRPASCRNPTLFGPLGAMSAPGPTRRVSGASDFDLPPIVGILIAARRAPAVPRCSDGSHR